MAETMMDPKETAVEADGTGASRPRRRRVGRWLVRGLLAVVLLVVLLVAGGALWLWMQLRASLPQNEGEAAVAALAAPVTVERDELGIPLVSADSRVDAAAALGFLHAQERLFQMDLMRRQAAGELAGLVGTPLVGADRGFRVHRFRHRAEQVLAQASPQVREVLEAYAAGVNAGAEAMDKPTFEYLVLGTGFEPWTPSDSVMVIYAMFMMLQDEEGVYESSLGVLHDTLPPEVAAFLMQESSDWDVPMLDGEVPVPPMPSAEVVDLRRAPLPLPAEGAVPSAAPEGEPADVPAAEDEEALDRAARLLLPSTFAFPTSPAADVAAASNAWAVTGEHTADGRALLASDMHIGLSLPNIWYRVSLRWPGGSRDGGGENRVDGVTVPGLPMMVVGSNGHVSWAFTSGRADTSDLIVLEPGDEPGTYRTPDGPRRFEEVTESLEVKGGEAEELVVEETIWGPVIGEDHAGRKRALAWVGHHPEATDLGLLEMETAKNVDEAMRVARSAGLPALNLLVADADGHIGWALAGTLPQRHGFSGRWPVSWADGSAGWDGWLGDDAVPVVVDPPGGRLWSGNNRMVGGETLAAFGDGNYTLGARAKQARDRLLELDETTPQDLLDLQLDDRAVFLERWQRLMVATLEAAGDDLGDGDGDGAAAEEGAASEDGEASEEGGAVVEVRPSEMLPYVRDWGGRAAPGSVGYLLVKDFRAEVAERVFAPLLAPALAADPELDYFNGYFRSEAPLWRLLEERPAHLLDPRYDDWDDLLVDALTGVQAQIAEDGLALEERTWGWENEVQIAHLFAGGVPVGRGMLSMPVERLPGDEYMPRVQGPAFGASQRMVVAPGHEDEAIFHMPGGESGHPLSDHFGDGHAAWSEGTATPLWPGEAVDTLTLVPVEGMEADG